MQWLDPNLNETALIDNLRHDRVNVTSQLIIHFRWLTVAYVTSRIPTYKHGRCRHLTGNWLDVLDVGGRGRSQAHGGVEEASPRAGGERRLWSIEKRSIGHALNRCDRFYMTCLCYSRDSHLLFPFLWPLLTPPCPEAPLLHQSPVNSLSADWIGLVSDSTLNRLMKPSRWIDPCWYNPTLKVSPIESTW